MGIFVNNMKTAVLLAALLGLCMLVGRAIGGPYGMVLGFLFGGLGNLVAYFFSDRIALASMGAQPVTRQDAPELVDAVARLAERAGLPTPRVYVCPQQAPNAFATGRNPSHAVVCVTSGMLERFPMQEIEAVLAHELGHVKHRDMLIATVAATIAGMISYAGYMLMWYGGGRSRDDRGGGLGALLMVILAPIAAAIIQLAISRQREYAADAYSGEITGNPLHLAAALRRLDSANQQVPMDGQPAYQSLFIVQPLSARSGLGLLFSTHPPIEKRIAALEREAEQMGVFVRR